MFQSVTINTATLSRGAHAAYDEVFKRRPVDQVLREMFFADEGATGVDDKYVTFGTLDKVGKKLNGESNPSYLNFNQYSNTVTIAEHGAAVAITKQQMKMAERVNGGTPFMARWHEIISSMSRDVQDLPRRFLEDALLGTTAYLPAAVDSPDGTITTVFDATGHFGGKIPNGNAAQGTGYSHATIRDNHLAMIDTLMSQQDDKGRLLHEDEPRGFVYLVDPQVADEYRTALKGKVFGAHAFGGASSVAPVAAVDNFLGDHSVVVRGWAPLRNSGYAFVRILDPGEGFADGAPFKFRTFEEANLVTEEKITERATVTSIHFSGGVRLSQPGGIFRIDKTS